MPSAPVGRADRRDAADGRGGTIRSAGCGLGRAEDSTRLERLTGGVRLLPVDGETIERVAQLRNECRVIGHALHQRLHDADLWIAAAAVRWSIPLVAHDSVFVGCPGLDLRIELMG